MPRAASSRAPRAQLSTLEARAGVEAHELGVGRQYQGVLCPPEPEDPREVLALELEEPRSVEVAQPAAFEVDRLGGDRGLHVLAAVAGGGGVRQEPRVQLDDDRATVVDLLGDLQRQRTVGLHLVDVDAEERLEVLGRRFEEGPLVAFEIGPHEAAERRERFVAPRVHKLDDDVRIAVALDVGPVRRVDGMRAVGARVEAQQAARARRSAHWAHSSWRTSAGHAAGSRPCARRSASTIRS